MKKTLYPKTKRIWDSNITITEKLDGSNLWIFNLGWELIIAQRNNVFKLSELIKENAYEWLRWWIEENKDELLFQDWSWVFWEWIWMWCIWYWEALDKKFYIFAKANINEEFEVRNILYKESLFIYPFINQEIPECMWVVEIIYEWKALWIDWLNEFYDNYCGRVNRIVEWFIINSQWSILKYVRFKGWKLTNHKEYFYQ